MKRKRYETAEVRPRTVIDEKTGLDNGAEPVDPSRAWCAWSRVSGIAYYGASERDAIKAAKRADNEVCQSRIMQ